MVDKNECVCSDFFYFLFFVLFFLCKYNPEVFHVLFCVVVDGEAASLRLLNIVHESSA